MGFVGRQSGIALFTAVETAGLGVWVALARGSVDVTAVEAFGVSARPATIGLAVLFVALVVEHLLTDATLTGPQGNAPVLTSVLLSATETALWALWLTVAEVVGGLAGVAVAGVVLLVLLVPQHTVEDNALRGRGLLSNLVDAGTLGFSLAEALGATVWLALLVDGSLLAVVESVPGVDPALAGTVSGMDPELAGLAALAVVLYVEHSLAVRYAGRVTGVGDRRPGDERLTRI